MLLLLTALLPSSAATLDITGSCGGPATIRISGLSRNQPYALFSAGGLGSASISGGPCQNVTLGLDQSRTLRKTGQSDSNGNVQLNLNVPAALCGTWLQVVDAGTCTTSNVDQFTSIIDNDGDGVEAGLDCNDNDPNVYPGAPELCDGIQTDCDNPGEVGVVTWYPTAGAPVDMSDDFVGTQGDEALVTIADNGRLAMCPGTYFTSLTMTGDDVVIEGTPTTRLNSGFQHRVFTHLFAKQFEMTDLVFENGQVRVFGGEDYDGTISNITHEDSTCVDSACLYLFGGDYVTPSQLSLSDITSSGGLYLQASADFDMTLTDVTLNGTGMTITKASFGSPESTAVIDGLTIDGLGASIEVDVGTISNLTIQNSSTVGMSFYRGDYTINGATIDGVTREAFNTRFANVTLNNADVTNTGGGFKVEFASTVTINDSEFYGNETAFQVLGSTLNLVDTLARDNATSIAGNAGGAIIDQQNATLTCTKTGAAPAGFLRNSGPQAGGVQFLDTATNLGTLISDGCDWGTGADDNTPLDIKLADGSTYSWGNNANFTCTDAVESLCLPN